MKKLRRIFRFLFPKSKVIFNDLERTHPVSPVFGFDRGNPIDRHYIEKFLSSKSPIIKGRVLEIDNNYYTRKFGDKDAQSEILHYDNSNPKATIIGDLTRKDTLPSDDFDCFICTQTYNFIYDAKAAMSGSYHLLKKGGTLLGTVSGISQISRYDMERWGDFWRFTDKSIEKLLKETGFSKIEISTMGNVMAATALLQGLAVEDLPRPSLLDERDEDYQVTICFAATK